MAKRSKAPTRKRRYAFFFTVSDKEVTQGLRSFARSINEDLLKDLESSKVSEKVAQNAIERLEKKWPVGPHIESGRLGLIKDLVRKSATTVSLLPNKTQSGVRAKIMGIVPRNIEIRVGNIKDLDARTRISVLDKQLPLRHIAGFEDNPIKTSSGVAKNKFQLWRLLEYPRKTAYVITPTSHIFLRFTSERDGFSSWNFKTSVRWRAKNFNKDSFYWFLTESRTLYAADANIIRRGIERSIKRLINKSKFRA